MCGELPCVINGSIEAPRSALKACQCVVPPRGHAHGSPVKIIQSEPVQAKPFSVRKLSNVLGRVSELQRQQEKGAPDPSLVKAFRRTWPAHLNSLWGDWPQAIARLEQESA